jgi:hypothetical protein
MEARQRELALADTTPQTGTRRETQQASGTRVAEELQAVDALIDHADGDQIWQVLDYAERQSVPVAEAYSAIIGDLPAQLPGIERPGG